MLLSVHLRIAIVDDAEVASFSGHHLQPDDGTSDGMCSFKGSQGVSFINAFHTDDRTKPHREDSQVKGRLLAGGREGKESVCVCVWGGGGGGGGYLHQYSKKDVRREGRVCIFLMSIFVTIPYCCSPSFSEDTHSIEVGK